MPGVTRQGIDSAGGLLLTGSNDVFANSSAIVRVGDVVQSHGDSPHDSAVMVTGSSTVFCNSIALCKAGDIASCSHPSSGSNDVFSG